MDKRFFRSPSESATVNGFSTLFSTPFPHADTHFFKNSHPWGQAPGRCPLDPYDESPRSAKRHAPTNRQREEDSGDAASQERSPQRQAQAPRCTQPPPAPKSVRGLREDRPAFRQISPFYQPRLGRSRKPSKTQRVWYHLRPTRGVTSSFQPHGLPPSSTSDDPLIRDRGRSIRSCWCLLLGHECSIQKEIFGVNPRKR